MIVVQICGGIGNQLFQYAYARALQERGNKVCLAAVFYTNYRTPRKYCLDKFRINMKRSYWLEKIISPLIDNDTIFKVRNSHIYEELEVKFIPELLEIRGNGYVIGMFQDERYFKSIGFEIKKEIYPKKKIKISTELRNILKNENAVSVHIRRGDYKQFNNLLSMTYYTNAIDLINKEIDNAYFCVFSDDLEWVKKHINFGNNVFFVNEDRKLMDYEELMIMSRCKHNIIANSTFSWWGAWLNNNPDKIVIGPRKWDARCNINIMPNEWIKV